MATIGNDAKAMRTPAHGVEILAFRGSAASGYHPRATPLPPREPPLQSSDAASHRWRPLLLRSAVVVLLCLLGLAVLISSPDERSSQRPSYVTD